ncbi:MAG: hypothetical protein EOO88_15830 [Pedobacter sp.]|nr:MAG: hypothetical protein EOO88_15830 [Pedobacter sp.]
MNKRLWFSVQINDGSMSEVVEVSPNTIQNYGPWSIPEGGRTLKVTIKSHADLYTPKREKPVIEELVFQKMIFK